MNNAESTFGAMRTESDAGVGDLFPLAFSFAKHKFQLGIGDSRLRALHQMSPEPTRWCYHRHQSPPPADRKRFSHGIRSKLPRVGISHSSNSVHYGEETMR